MVYSANRYISNLTRDTYAIVLAGGKGSRLHELTQWRAKPALYFGGNYRLIDFPLSNCFNSGIKRVGIATQYKSHSLIRHINRAWSHFKKELGESVEILPASQQQGDQWYSGTADAVFQNISIIRHELPKYVMILSGDHIYRMDYGVMIAEHVERGADMTVSCIKMPVEEAANTFGVLKVDENGRVMEFQEKPAEPAEIPGEPGMCLASMGNYVFNTEFMYEQLERDAQTKGSHRDFGYDIIPSIIENHNVYAYEYVDPYDVEPYWRDVGTLDSFWEANMELVSTDPALNLYDERWPIWGFQEQAPPAKFVFEEEDRRGAAYDSIVCRGCIISGAELRRTLLFPKSRVHSFTQIEESVILPGSIIHRNCKIRKAIIDRSCEVPEGTVIGYDHDQDRANGFRVSKNGVVLVSREMLTEYIARQKES